jgi:hypothetical protein
MRPAPCLPVCLVLALAGVMPSALAQMAMKPGLWENSVQMRSGNGQMEAAMAQMQSQMASLPPDQRKMMQDMMAKQGVGVGAQPNTVRVCVSPEAAARGEMPASDGKCQQTITQRSATGMKFSFNCPGNPPTRGEGEYRFDGPGAYSGKMVMNTLVDGKPERLEMMQSGRWLGADCGALKPRP